jgi:hypothetical protein
VPSSLRTLLRLTPVVAGASAVSFVGLLAFRAVISMDELRASSGEVGNYLQTIGGIYAVLLAFVVYAVWGQFNDARSTADREAAALVDLHRTASGLPPASRVEIQRGLREYVDAVLGEEWEAMARNDEKTIERIGEILDRVWIAIHRCQPASECQHTVYGEILSRFNSLTDLRTSRLTSSRTRIPAVMRMLLYTGGVLTTGSMYLLSIEKLWIHGLVTAALGGAVAHILYLIRDLDEPFAGNLQVAKAPYERARRSFERATHLVDVDAVA